MVLVPAMVRVFAMVGVLAMVMRVTRFIVSTMLRMHVRFHKSKDRLFSFRIAFETQVT